MSFFVIHSLGTFSAPVSLTDNQNDTSLSLHIETCMKIYLWLHSPKVWCLKNIINLLLCSMVLELIEFSCGGGGVGGCSSSVVSYAVSLMVTGDRVI